MPVAVPLPVPPAAAPDRPPPERWPRSSRMPAPRRPAELDPGPPRAAWCRALRARAAATSALLLLLGPPVGQAAPASGAVAEAAADGAPAASGAPPMAAPRRVAAAPGPAPAATEATAARASAAVRRRAASAPAGARPRLPARAVTPSAAAASPPAASDAGPAGDPAALPTYATRMPPPARISYRLSRGGIVGSGEIDWQPQGAAYTLRLEGRVPLLGTLIVQTSRGGFDAAGLAPLRYTDKRLRRPERAADFDRAAGKVAFSNGDAAIALSAGLQDRVSVMLQLAAIANGWARTPAAGAELRIRVVGARGDDAVWSLRFEGPQAVETPEGPVPALRFLREPERPHDTRAEFWLDPARSFMPVRARLTDGSGDALELLRVSGPP